MRLLPRVAITRLTGALTAFLVGFAFSGTDARAGCGDDHFMLPPSVGDQPGPAKPPCHGPNCSAQQQEREPLLPQRATTTTQVEQWARPHADFEFLPLPEWRSPVASTADPSVRRPLDIFHPPRLG